MCRRVPALSLDMGGGSRVFKHCTHVKLLLLEAGYCLALDLTARDLQLAAKEKGAFRV